MSTFMSNCRTDLSSNSSPSNPSVSPSLSCSSSSPRHQRIDRPNFLQIHVPQDSTQYQQQQQPLSAYPIPLCPIKNNLLIPLVCPQAPPSSPFVQDEKVVEDEITSSHHQEKEFEGVLKENLLSLSSPHNRKLNRRTQSATDFPSSPSSTLLSSLLE